MANREIRSVACGTLNRVGQHGISRVPWCGKCGAAIPQTKFMQVARRLYQLRRFYWIGLVGGVVLIVLWRDPPGTSAPGPTTRAERIAAGCDARPRTGVLRNYEFSSDNAAPLEIRTATGASYYVKLADATTGDPIQTFFIRGGQTLVAKVPLGKFVLKYATGRAWCGESRLFGPETQFHKADVVLEFERLDTDGGYTLTGHTIELISKINGNLKTSGINAAAF
jgi:hypothetical protein